MEVEEVSLSVETTEEGPEKVKIPSLPPGRVGFRWGLGNQLLIFSTNEKGKKRKNWLCWLKSDVYLPEIRAVGLRFKSLRVKVDRRIGGIFLEYSGESKERVASGRNISDIHEISCDLDELCHAASKFNQIEEI
jgi:hypothetical protein